MLTLRCQFSVKPRVSFSKTKHVGYTLLPPGWSYPGPAYQNFRGSILDDLVPACLVHNLNPWFVFMCLTVTYLLDNLVFLRNSTRM